MANWAAPPTKELTGIAVDVVVLGLTGVGVTGGAGGADVDGVVTAAGVLAAGALDHSLQPELGTTGGGAGGGTELVTTGGAGGGGGGGTEVVTTGGAGTVEVDHSDQE